MSDTIISPKSKKKQTTNLIQTNNSSGNNVKLTIQLTANVVSNIQSINQSIAQSSNQPVDVYDTRFTCNLLGQQLQSVVSSWDPIKSNATSSAQVWTSDIDLIMTRDMLITMEKSPFVMNIDTKHTTVSSTSINPSINQLDETASPLPTSKRQIEKPANAQSKPGSASTKKKTNQLNNQSTTQSNDPQTLIKSALDSVAFGTSNIQSIPFMLPLASLLAAPFEVTYQSRSRLMACSISPGLIDWQVTLKLSNDPIPLTLRKELMPLTVFVQSIQPSISLPLSYEDMDRVYRPTTLSISLGNQSATQSIYPTHWQFIHTRHVLLPQSLNRTVIFLGLLSQSDWLSLLSESRGLNIELMDRDHRCVKTVEEAEAEEREKKLKEQQQIEQERKRLNDKKKKGIKSPTNKELKEVSAVAASQVVEPAEPVRPQSSSPFESALASLNSSSYDARSNVHGRGIVSMSDLFRCASKPRYQAETGTNIQSDTDVLVATDDDASVEPVRSTPFRFAARVPLHAVFPARPLPLIPPQTRFNQYEDSCVSCSFELDSSYPLPSRDSLRQAAPISSLVAVMQYNASVYSDVYSQITTFNEEAVGLPTEQRVRGALARVNADQVSEQADYVNGISISDGQHRWLFLEGRREGEALKALRQTLMQTRNQLLLISPDDDTAIASARTYMSLPLSLQHCRLRSPVTQLLVPSSINAQSFDCLCLLRSLIARENSESTQLLSPLKCSAVEREFGSAVSDADVFGAQLIEAEEESRRRVSKQLLTQSIEERESEATAAKNASKRERAALDAVKRKATNLLFSSSAHEEQKEWQAQATKKNDQSNTIKAPVFLYSNPAEYEQQVERMREFCHSDPRLHWTFHPDFLVSSIPRYESKEQVEAIERAESKSKWIDPRGFVMPPSNGAKNLFSTTPLISETERTAESPQLSIEQRVDAARKHRAHVQAAKRELAFNLTPVPPALFDPTPQSSVHRQSDAQIIEQRTREAQEKLDRQSRVCVDDETFYVAVGKTVGNCKLESIAPIRRDSPRKMALKYKPIEQLPVSITNTQPYQPPSDFKFRESAPNPNEPEFVRYVYKHDYVHKPKRSAAGLNE